MADVAAGVTFDLIGSTEVVKRDDIEGEGRPVSDEPVLWIDEGRPADNPYLGIAPRIHGLADHEPHAHEAHRPTDDDRRRARISRGPRG
jgi:hypothetical protein